MELIFWFFISIAIIAMLFYSLPILVGKLRNYMLLKITHGKGIAVPNKNLPVTAFDELYSNPNSNGKSKHSSVADFLWYFHAPSGHMLQEMMEDGEKNKALSKITGKILAIKTEQIKILVEKYVDVIFTKNISKQSKILYIYSFIAPLWVNFMAEIIFNEPFSEAETNLVVKNINNFFSCLKFRNFRNMKVRNELTQLIQQKLITHKTNLNFPTSLTDQEKALYIRGTFFVAAASQLSEASAHILLCLAKSSIQQDKIRKNKSHITNVIDETLRLYPLIAFTNRILKDDVILANGKKIPKKSILRFDIAAYQKIDYQQANEFIPERWENIDKRTANFIPFGYKSNRPCPAQRLARIALTTMIETVIKNYDFTTTVNHHTRALTNYGPCIIMKRDKKPWIIHKVIYSRLIDIPETICISIKQIFLGFYLIIESQKLKLSTRYYQKHVE